MEQSEQSLFDELHSEWLKLHSQEQFSKTPKSKKSLALKQRHISSLQKLLDKAIKAGKLVSQPASREKLQWLARDIGDAIYSLTSK